MPSRSKSPNVWIKDQGTEEFLKRILMIWARDRPNHYAEFRKIVETEMTNLVTPSGMSREGSFALKGHIPTDVYIVIEGKYPGFFRDPRNCFLVHRMILGDLDPSRQVKRLNKAIQFIDRRSPNVEEAPPASSSDAAEVSAKDSD